jgi:hypothetical protein
LKFYGDPFLQMFCNQNLYFATKLAKGGRHARGRMLVGFTTTYAISAYYHYRCEFESRTWRGVLNTILCDKVCQ